MLFDPFWSDEKKKNHELVMYFNTHANFRTILDNRKLSTSTFDPSKIREIVRILIKKYAAALLYKVFTMRVMY